MTSSRPVIILTSLSAKISLYNQVLKSARLFDGRSLLIGIDCDENCQAAPNVESFSHSRPINEMEDDSMIEYFVSLGTTHLIPTRDQELPFWSSKKTLLHEKGVRVMISTERAIRLCQNKLLFSQSFEKLPVPAIPAARSLSSLSGNNFVVKEELGSGSHSIGINLSDKDALTHAENLVQPIFQPMVYGPEFSAETWIDSSGSCHGMLLRWRTKIVDGEAHESETFRNAEWESLMQTSLESIPGLYGHVLAQVIVDPDMGPRMIEINPRLGGASPLALAAGLNSIEWFLLETAGRQAEIPNKPILNKKLRLRKIDGVANIF